MKRRPKVYQTVSLCLKVCRKIKVALRPKKKRAR